MIYINFFAYPRNSVSDFLQISQECENAGNPLPCWLVEQAVEAHDAMLTAQPVIHTTAQPDRPAPPCEGCAVARWIKYPCGRMEWECEGKKDGKCRAV